MIKIAHRGNTKGPNKETENLPEYILEAITLGYDAEIDLWVEPAKDWIYAKLFLGHDKPQYAIDFRWLIAYNRSLWVHCKSKETAIWVNKFEKFTGTGLNYFWHENDTMTLTSKGYWWVYPGKQPMTGSIAVMPELYNDDVSQCIGVCSDYLE
jgi:hypothetical protein